MFAAGSEAANPLMKCPQSEALFGVRPDELTLD